MRILVINQYFHPDVASSSQLLTELCEDLATHHEVTVVCGRPSYDPLEQIISRGLIHRDHHAGVQVLRTWSTSFPRRFMAGRLSNYATYLTSSMVGATRDTKPDVILTMTDPPIVATVALAVSKLWRVPFVYINQDIFPSVAVILGQLQSRLLIASLSSLNRALRSHAARVVVIGRDMERRLATQGVPPAKIRVIPNWADGSLIRPLEGASRLRLEQGWQDRFVVMHSGNVGLSQELGVLLEAADRLRGHEDVAFAIVGNGAAKAGLQREAARRRLGNVRFLPYRPKEELSDSLGAADVHVVSLRRGLAGCIVPSKVYGIMAAGRPFIGAVEESSEVAMIIREHECGARIDPNDPDALARAILKMRETPRDAMGKRGRLAFERLFDRPIATEAYRELLEEVASRGRP
jgi:colanic acid biosynthesis glycosyl transferase WcaI